ncbi:MAG: hypothetical protein ACFB0C_22110 [Leptolyngbyaceae cyanobacterium]
MTFRALSIALCAAGLCPGILLAVPAAHGLQLTRSAEPDPLAHNLLQATDFSEFFSTETASQELETHLEGIAALQGLEFYASIRNTPLRSFRSSDRSAVQQSLAFRTELGTLSNESGILRADDGDLANQIGTLRADNGALATATTTARTGLYEASGDRAVRRTQTGILENDQAAVRTNSGLLEAELEALDKASTETTVNPNKSAARSSNSTLLAGGEPLLDLAEEPTQTAEEIRAEEEARKERARQQREDKAARLEASTRNRTADMVANGALAGLVVVTIISAVIYDVRGKIAGALSGKPMSQPYQPTPSATYQSSERR